MFVVKNVHLGIKNDRNIFASLLESQHPVMLTFDLCH